MQTSVNSRILLLKSQLALSNNEFATRANISTTTLWNIQNEGDIAPKTIRNICEALNVNKEWLMTGNGPMFNEENRSTNDGGTLSQALDLLREQLSKKDEQIASLLSMLGKVNFPEPVEETGMVKLVEIAMLPGVPVRRPYAA